MEVAYSPKFIRLLNVLPARLQDEVVEKIALFKNTRHHTALKVHKLHGRLKEQYSFSVNYQIRITFVYLPKKPKEAYLLTIGDHEVYDR